MEAGGVWSSTAYIGIGTDANKRFDILALVADRDIQDSFTAYLAESRARGHEERAKRAHALMPGTIADQRARADEARAAR